jgi:phosphatidylglycerophosphate synthase
MSQDTWLHRLARPAARALAATPVTPNQITTLRLAVGLAAAGAFAVGSSAALAWGAGLFLVAMVLDRLDGELARVSGRSSPFGHRYDILTDACCESLAFVALGLGLREGRLGNWALALGLLAGLGVGFAFLRLHWRASAMGAGSPALRLSPRVDPDDLLIAVPLAIWLGAAEWLLVAGALGTPLFALYVIWWEAREGSTS